MYKCCLRKVFESNLFRQNDLMLIYLCCTKNWFYHINQERRQKSILLLRSVIDTSQILWFNGVHDKEYWPFLLAQTSGRSFRTKWDYRCPEKVVGFYIGKKNKNNFHNMKLLTVLLRGRDFLLLSSERVPPNCWRIHKYALIGTDDNFRYIMIWILDFSHLKFMRPVAFQWPIFTVYKFSLFQWSWEKYLSFLKSVRTHRTG